VAGQTLTLSELDHFETIIMSYTGATAHPSTGTSSLDPGIRLPTRTCHDEFEDRIALLPSSARDYQRTMVYNMEHSHTTC
jgi:hypothetical protein